MTSAVRRGLIWSACLGFALVALALLAAAALDAGYFHDLAVRLIRAKIDRPVRVAGSLRLHLLSLHPRLVAEQVSIGSPSWAPSGMAAEAAKITVVFATPHFAQELKVDRLTIEHATLHLFRDDAGHANWQLKNPDNSPPQNLPILHSLSMLDAHVVLDDALKHRRFDGTVSAYDASAAQVAQPFRVAGKGKLNGRPVVFEVQGDPLPTASRDKRYAFRFSEHSSGAQLSGSGFLRQGFDLRRYDATFEASGADLKDMYYLTGTGLIDTADFHLSGKLAVQGRSSSFSDLLVTSGQSDVRGSMSIEGKGGQLDVEGDFNSQTLRLADLGLRAAGRDPRAAQETLLLSDAAPDPGALRRSRAALRYSARRVQIGRYSLSDVALKVRNDHGELAVVPITGALMGGKLDAQLNIDARQEPPAARLSGSISQMQLAQLPRKNAGPPAFDAAVDLHADLAGRGKSLHQAAASVDGTITATMAGGMMRDALAELAGIDLRGLGLLLAKNKKEVPVRCAVANFEARDGTLTAKNLLIDTDPVLIVGAGSVHMDTETLDLELRGYPKNVRILQLRAPILIQGTLKAPSMGIQAHDSKLVLVDPGKAKDADCGTLLR